ncbi:metallopeptidase TldD-related protein [Streptomyces sp. NBC_01013]|uniref:metallopeptidase TldD-related protein n=1 Tax=Streptomyces sp. NBC_01013 TaxID=2903718 RepID=UPI003869F013|nr:metallopeptidase TldD-related protein [Streptomyces sp. NBC_01013]
MSDVVRELGSRALLDEAARRGADCEVWSVRRETEEVVCRGGTVERRSDVVSGATAVTVWCEGTEGYAVQALPDSADPALVRSALAVGRALPDRVVAPDDPPPAPERPVRAVHRPCLDEATVGAVRSLSEARTGLDIELRARAERSSVRLHRQGGEARGYRTGLFQLQARVTSTTADGVGFVSHQAFGDRAAGPLGEAAPRDLAELCELADVLATPPVADPRYDDVLVTGWVMVKLLALVAPAFQLDTVNEGRSPLAGRTGRRVCAPGVDLVDDPAAPEYPLAAPWDDEGTPTRAVPLVTDGVLRRFLGNRRSAPGPTDRGSGWRGASGEMPRVGPSHLSLRPGPVIGAGPREGRRLLRVVQANGAHTSNGITGDFSIGANAVLEEPGGVCRNAGNITLAGNVFELLRRIEGHDGVVRVSRSHTAFLTSPGVWANHLTIGR